MSQRCAVGKGEESKMVKGMKRVEKERKKENAWNAIFTAHTRFE